MIPSTQNKSSRLETLVASIKAYADRENSKNWKERLSDRFHDVFDLSRGIGKSGLKMLQEGVQSSPPGVLVQELSRAPRMATDWQGYKLEQRDQQQALIQNARETFKNPGTKLKALWANGLDYLTNRASDFLQAPRSRQVESLGRWTGNLLPVVVGGLKARAGASAIPGGSLAAHEGIPSLFGAPTHLLEKHVGKSLPEMLERLTQQRSRQISSFRNLQEAEQFVAMALRKESASIQQFAASPLSNIPKNNRLILDVALGRKTGDFVRQGSLQLQPAHGVRLILDKIPNAAKLPFVIFTGFPIK